MQPALLDHPLTLCPELPDHLRQRLAGQTVTIDRLPRQVRLRLRMPEKIRVSEWAEKYRVVTDGAHEGPWRHDYAPHTVKIMDTFGQPWVREVWFCGVEQSGKTNTMINCIGWAVDCDPGNIFYLMPTEDTAAKVTGGKLKPTLARSPRLARYLSGRQDDATLARINLVHGVTIFPAHANSASSMATWAAKHCFGDEIDKYPAMAGKETDPITLIKKRNRTYKGRYKRFFASTPAGLFAYKGVQNCHQVWEYRVKCPDCGELIRMDAGHLVLSGPGTGDQGPGKHPGPTPEDVERDGAAYACNACGVEWDDRQRDAAIRTGRWLCVKGADVTRPAKVGFHHRAWECLDITLSEIATAWLRGQQGGLAEKIAWANGYEAVDYVAKLSDRKEDHILRLRDSRPEGIVPSDPVQIITLHADTQDNGFWYTVRAWGYGDTIPTWLLKAGFVETLSGLDAIMASDWPTIDGTPHRISLGIIDSQGHRTAEVYEWCKRTGVLAAAGASGRKSRPVTRSVQDTYPGTNRPIPGGLELYSLDTHFFKDALAHKLQVEPTDPGAWLLHCGFDADHLALMEQNPKIQYPHNLDAYARHLCAEGRDERGLWQNPTKKANHLFDCEVYGLALIYYLRQLPEFRNARPPTEVEEAIHEIATQKQVAHKSRRW